MPDQDPLTVARAYRVRTLGTDEWATYPLPYPVQHLNPQFARIVVVESADGTLVGSWVAMNTVHLEGLWIAPSHRHTVPIAARLFAGMLELLQAEGIGAAVTITQDPVVTAMAKKAGFEEIPGTIFQRAIAPKVDDAPVEVAS